VGGKRAERTCAIEGVVGAELLAALILRHCTHAKRYQSAMERPLGIMQASNKPVVRSPLTASRAVPVLQLEALLAARVAGAVRGRAVPDGAAAARRHAARQTALERRENDRHSDVETGDKKRGEWRAMHETRQGVVCVVNNSF
jgi:hypothetical protein